MVQKRNSLGRFEKIVKTLPEEVVHLFSKKLLKKIDFNLNSCFYCFTLAFHNNQKEYAK